MAADEGTDRSADERRTTTAEIVPVRLPPLADEPEPEPLTDPRTGDVDEWGRSERVREWVRKAYDPMYRHWFRAEWDGLDKIPTEGGALLVANHAGAIPSDAPTIMHGVETELRRPVYGLADQFFKGTPVVGTLWSRTGGVVAHPDNAYRLLRHQQQLVLVFPEGSKGPAKTYNERYRLRRFGRGGFVEIAMRAGVPIIPIAVVGAEESMPILFKVPSVAKTLRAPVLPRHRQHGARAARRLRALPGQVQAAGARPGDLPRRGARPAPLLRSRIMDESEAIRQQIQEALFDMLRQRRSVWFG